MPPCPISRMMRYWPAVAARSRSRSSALMRGAPAPSRAGAGAAAGVAPRASWSSEGRAVRLVDPSPRACAPPPRWRQPGPNIRAATGRGESGRRDLAAGIPLAPRPGLQLPVRRAAAEGALAEVDVGADVERQPVEDAERVVGHAEASLIAAGGIEARRGGVPPGGGGTHVDGR